ncbi:hypothetical protein RchiOBHm_Chr7g0187151 [Rosa chinensis]|uniref:Secreted protein n=1 Tax=Rosa chinensis TaxID=74649 RepID=A0A2P6P456_ROSCH|nr:hypothetical protein RchiOBHm_Chr7g0187151 [Rosa chinensis]
MMLTAILLLPWPCLNSWLALEGGGTHGYARESFLIFFLKCKTQRRGTLLNVKEGSIYRSTARVHKAIRIFHIASTNDNSPSKLVMWSNQS